MKLFQQTIPHLSGIDILETVGAGIQIHRLPDRCAMAVPVPFRLFPVSGKEILFTQDDSKFRIPQAVFPLGIRMVFSGIFPGSPGKR